MSSASRTKFSVDFYVSNSAVDITFFCCFRMPGQVKVDRAANQVLSFNVIPAAPKLEVRGAFTLCRSLSHLKVAITACLWIM